MNVTNLDKLSPEPKKIILSGKEVTLYPGKIKALIKIQKAFVKLRDSELEDKLQHLEEVVNALSILIPRIKDDDIDLSFEQITDIVNMAYASSMPANKEIIEENKMAVNTEKKK